MGNFPGGNCPKVWLGPVRLCRLKWGPSAAARMGYGAKRRSFNRLGAERCDSDRLGKLPLGKLHIWEVATWEKSFGKERNKIIKNLINLALIPQYVVQILKIKLIKNLNVKSYQI